LFIERFLTILKSLRNTIKSVAVLGPNADNNVMLLGNYHGIPETVVTPLEVSICAKRDYADHLLLNLAQNMGLLFLIVCQLVTRFQDKSLVVLCTHEHVVL
jgi:hypothetical protein